ncbi:MAG: hypothetical protein IRZ33_11840, partial [Alicyclobacillaceae bacterium]|nr:hypothetical protein [Alicyclobacillaceae bacterium]
IHPTRLALTGVTVGPGLFDVMALLGRDECVSRLRRAAAWIRGETAAAGEGGAAGDAVTG